MTPSRASRMDFEMEDENDGQISAREPLQNSGRDYKDIYDNKLRYEKSQVNIQKRTKTPIDKVRILEYCFWLLILVISSPELNFLIASYLSSVRLSVYLLSIYLSINFYIFDFFSRTSWQIFNQT
jgi:hypothetical protein